MLGILFPPMFDFATAPRSTAQQWRELGDRLDGRIDLEAQLLGLPRLGSEPPDYRHRRLLAGAASGHTQVAPPSSVMKSRRL